MFKPACTHAVRAYAGSETDAVRAPGRRVFLPDDAQCTIVSSSFASGRLARRDAAFISRRGYVAGLGLLPSAGRRACVRVFASAHARKPRMLHGIADV